MVDFNKINKWNAEIDKIKIKLKDEKEDNDFISLTITQTTINK
mgnify:CR=1 FL=1